MPVLAGEPWRGAAKVVSDGALGDRIAWAVLYPTGGAVPAEPTTDQATWDSTPGNPAWTMRVEWAATGAPNDGQIQTIEVGTYLPGTSTQVGTTWAVTVGTDAGSAERAWHFDSDPLSGALEASRSGAVEIYIKAIRTSAVAWNLDSRGANSGMVGTPRWAAGYARSRLVLSSHSISNVAIGGAAPSLWAFPDPVHTRITRSATVYEVASMTLSLRKPANGAMERQETLAVATPNADFSWTSSTGNNRRVANGMTLAVEAKDLRADLAAVAVFAGKADNKFVWADTGHETNWLRDSELSLRYPNRVTADPRITVAHLMQVNTADFATPPLSLDTAQRLTSDLAFLSARFRNARDEGQNGLNVEMRMWDTGELSFTETVAYKTVANGTDTNGGEAGWFEKSPANTVPFVWDSQLPGGSWTVKITMVTPDTNGLASPVIRNVSLLAPDPAISVIASGGPTDKARHWTAGQNFQAGLAAVKVDTQKLLTIDDAKVALVRLQDSGLNQGRAEYLDSDMVWKRLDSAATLYFWTASESIPGVSRIYLKTFTGTQTAGWGDYDIFVVGRATINLVPYGLFGKEIGVGVSNDHGGYALDALGLALSGVLSQK